MRTIRQRRCSADPGRILVHLLLGRPVVTGDIAQITVARPNRAPAEVELRVVGMTWNGQPAYLADLRDVSARRAEEERLRQLQKLEAVGRLAAGITHDFRNLIAVVQAGLRLVGNKVRDGASQADISTLVEEVMKRTENAETLTSQLLSFSRSQASTPPIVDINRRIVTVASMLSQTLGGSIKIRMDLADDVGAIEIDANQLDMALLNLALNSRDAMDGHGTLTIESRLTAAPAWRGEQTEVVRVTVRDTGAGMTAEVKDKVFEPFFTTKGDGNGTGLGLIQVHEFVARSGGQVQIDSELGTGTAVHLFFPKHSGVTASL